MFKIENIIKKHFNLKELKMRPFNRPKNRNNKHGSRGDPGQCGALGNSKYCSWNNRCSKCLKQGYTSRIYSKL